MRKYGWHKGKCDFMVNSAECNERYDRRFEMCIKCYKAYNEAVIARLQPSPKEIKKQVRDYKRYLRERS